MVQPGNGVYAYIFGGERGERWGQVDWTKAEHNNHLDDVFRRIAWRRKPFVLQSVNGFWAFHWILNSNTHYYLSLCSVCVCVLCIVVRTSAQHVSVLMIARFIINYKKIFTYVGIVKHCRARSNGRRFLSLAHTTVVESASSAKWCCVCVCVLHENSAYSIGKE